MINLLPNLTTAEFLLSLKRFIARRGRPERIYSDNGDTFVVAEKWIRMVRNDERFSRLSGQARNSVAIQPQPSPVVGWTI